MNNSLMQMLTQVGKLKTLPRTGWGMVGIKDAESVSDHSFRVSFMAMLIAQEYDCDQLKLIKMALVHDVGESIAGDDVLNIGTQQVASKEDKHAKEKAAMQEIFGANFSEYYKLWAEFEAQETREAIILKQIDKLEMMLQALEYERAGYPADELDEFWEYGDGWFEGKELEKMYKELKVLR